MEQDGISDWTIQHIRHVHTGSIVYPPRGTYGPHHQAALQLVTLHSGSLELHIDERIVNVAPGNTVLLLPGHSEFFAFSRTEDSWHRWLTLSPQEDYPAGMLEQLRLLPPVIRLTESMNKLIDVAISVSQTSSGTLDALKLIGLSALHLYEAETHLEAERKRVHRAVTITKGVISNRYMEPLTLGELAVEAYVTKEHLIRLFQLYEYISPIKHLWKVRLDRSKELLSSTGLSIGEIAERTGFKNTHHYSRMFKQSTGVTPTEYRASRG